MLAGDEGSGEGGVRLASAQGIFVNFGGPAVSAAKVKADVIALAESVAKNL